MEYDVFGKEKKGGEYVPEQQRCEAELFFETYMGIEPKQWHEDQPVASSVGNIINLMVMFRDEQLTELNGKLRDERARRIDEDRQTAFIEINHLKETFLRKANECSILRDALRDVTKGYSALVTAAGMNVDGIPSIEKARAALEPKP